MGNNNHVLEVKETPYIKGFLGICVTCYNPEFDGENYLHTESFFGNNMQDVLDQFNDHAFEKDEE